MFFGMTEFGKGSSYWVFKNNSGVIKVTGKIKIISLLILIYLFFVNMNYAFCSSEEKDTKQKLPQRLKKLHFIPQHDLIVAPCGSLPNGSIRFWSISEGKLKEVIGLDKGEWTSSLAVSNDATLIVAALFGLRTNEIGCFPLKEKKWLWRVNWVGKGVVGNAMRFTPDDRKVVVVDFKNIVTYDAATGAAVGRQEDSKGFSCGFPKHRTRINAISPSARYAAFWQGNLQHDEGLWSSGNIWVVVRDIEGKKIIAKQGNIQEKYKNCSALFTPDEKNLVLGSMDGYVRIWSVTEQKIIGGWKAYGPDTPIPFRKDPAPYFISSMVFSHDGQYLATLGSDIRSGFSIRIWEYSTNKLIHEFPKVVSLGLSMCSEYPMAFSPDGKYFAFEQQGQLCLYDTQNWHEKWCVFSWPEDNRMK
jgi:WD40 repeat protein